MFSIDNIITELQAGKEARERVPALEAEARQYLRERDAAQEHSQVLEITISTLRSEIADLTAKLRSVEAERDDYGFRQMQADDTLAKLREILGLNASEARVKELEAKLTDEYEMVRKLQEDKNALADELYLERSKPVIVPKPSEGFPDNPISSLSDTSVGVVFDGDVPATADPSPPQPYLGVPYYAKPDGVSWETFIAGGGEKPHWMN